MLVFSFLFYDENFFIMLTETVDNLTRRKDQTQAIYWKAQYRLREGDWKKRRLFVVSL